MTQLNRVLNRLKQKSLTPFEAWSELGVSRLAARVLELRQRGINIESKLVKVKNRFGEDCKVCRYFYRGKK